MNLSTAISEQRSKSIGIRKVIGRVTDRIDISGIDGINAVQFHFCTFSSCSLFSFCCLTFPVLPAFHSTIRYWLNKWVVWSLVCFVIVSAVTGWDISVVDHLFIFFDQAPKRTIPKGRFILCAEITRGVSICCCRRNYDRRICFIETAELHAITRAGHHDRQGVVLNAMNFDKETWSDAAGGFVVDSAYANKVEVFKNELRSRSSIANVTSLSHLPGEVPSWGTEFKAESINAEKAYRLLGCRHRLRLHQHIEC
jgi:hypothetical protein